MSGYSLRDFMSKHEGLVYPRVLTPGRLRLMRTESLKDLLREFPDTDHLWDFNDLIKTEDTIRQSILKESSVDLLTQLARVQGLLGNLHDTAATLALAKELLTTQNLTGTKAEIKLFLEQGRFFTLSMNPPQSLVYFSKAWTLAQDLK